MEGSPLFQVVALVSSILIPFTLTLPTISAQIPGLNFTFPPFQVSIPPLPAGINLPPLPNGFSLSGTPPALPDSPPTADAQTSGPPFQTTVSTSSSTSAASPVESAMSPSSATLPVDGPVLSQFAPFPSLPGGSARVDVPASAPGVFASAPADFHAQPAAAPSLGVVAPSPSSFGNIAVSSNARPPLREFSLLVGTVFCYGVINILL